MTLFRQDLFTALPPADTTVPRKKHMMCLNEGFLNPYDIVKGSFEKIIKEVELNRYYDSINDRLKAALTAYAGHNLKQENLLWGNGADEILFSCFLAVRASNSSFALSLAPSYFDYATYTRSVGLNLQFLDFEKNFDFNEKKYVQILNAENCVLGLLCTPNNPTGHLLDDDKIFYILNNTDKAVIIDEAYFEFSKKTYADFINKYPNLIIVRTFSKAFSCAGLRFGYLISQPQNVKEIRKAQTEFQTSLLTQAFALALIENKTAFNSYIEKVIEYRNNLYAKMKTSSTISVLPSNANFLTFSAGEKTQKLFEALQNNDIAVRNVGSHPLLANHLRVSIASKEQNALFAEVIGV